MEQAESFPFAPRNVIAFEESSGERHPARTHAAGGGVLHVEIDGGERDELRFIAANPPNRFHPRILIVAASDGVRSSERRIVSPPRLLRRGSGRSSGDTGGKDAGSSKRGGGTT